tara:strand:+ start:129 stop:326 length:198 start_codon:yes stop_codon:yes gene_type:complete
MIDFAITKDNKLVGHIKWSKLCQNMKVKPYMPSTPELALIKVRLEKELELEKDSITVRMNGQAIL